MKSAGKKINGILLLDKPKNITSNGVLQRIKHLFGAKKAGHTGSLDPLATGMLPICFGEATKFSQYLLEADKSYRVTAKLGVRTTTCDAEGEVIATQPVQVTREQLEKIIPQFTGSIEQIPPMYSAIKFQGKPLYRLARKGIEVERQARTVCISALTIQAFEGDLMTLEVSCTKGTYIRTLVDDIGLQLGCGAHVVELRRLSVSHYPMLAMHTLATLEMIANQEDSAALLSYLLPLETAVQALPSIQLSSSATFYLKMGQSVMVSSPHLSGFIRLLSEEGQLIGIGEMLGDGRVVPKRLIADKGQD